MSVHVFWHPVVLRHPADFAEETRLQNKGVYLITAYAPNSFHVKLPGYSDSSPHATETLHRCDYNTFKKAFTLTPETCKFATVTTQTI